MFDDIDLDDIDLDRVDRSEIRASKQRVKPCGSCPMIPGSTTCFSRSALKGSLVKNIENGYVHPCHSDDQFACAGSLSFIKQHEPGGLDSKFVVAFAIGTGLYDRELIEDLPVYGSIEAMLSDHDRKSKLIGGFVNDIFE
jgi:hypothetical protein